MSLDIPRVDPRVLVDLEEKPEDEEDMYAGMWHKPDKWQDEHNNQEFYK